MVDAESLKLGINLGFGCAAGLVAALCEGMTSEQVARFLDNLGSHPEMMDTIATAAVHDALSGEDTPSSYMALIERITEIAAARERGQGGGGE